MIRFIPRWSMLGGHLAIVIVLAIIVGGCTRSSEPQSDVTTTTTTSPASTTTTAANTVPTSDEVPSIQSDFGVNVSDKTITIGILADLTGPYAGLTGDVTDAQKVYWQSLNDSGGIDGWTVDLVIRDTRDDVDLHRAAYEEIRDDVVALSQSTGSSTNIALLPRYVEDEMLVIPLSWYSGWPFPSVDGGVILEQNTNYCIEAMNIVDFIVSEGGQSIALASFDDEYGQDAAAGVRTAADFYGIDIVFDGTGSVIPGDEMGEVVRGITESEADWTFLATSPSVGAEIMSSAARIGYEGLFTGPAPAYDSRLLDSASAELYSDRFYQSAYNVAWGEDEPGNVAMMTAMTGAFPDRRPSDAFIIGWNSATSMRQVLERAIQSGNLTRQGVIDASQTLDSIDFGGSAPPQGYVGLPNGFVNRESAIYRPNLDAYVAAGGPAQTLDQTGATTGSLVVRPFFAGEAAQNLEFSAPCFPPG